MPHCHSSRSKSPQHHWCIANNLRKSCKTNNLSNYHMIIWWIVPTSLLNCKALKKKKNASNSLSKSPKKTFDLTGWRWRMQAKVFPSWNTATGKKLSKKVTTKPCFKNYLNFWQPYINLHHRLLRPLPKGVQSKIPNQPRLDLSSIGKQGTA